jgi:hypothetical protein
MSLQICLLPVNPCGLQGLMALGYSLIADQLQAMILQRELVMRAYITRQPSQMRLWSVQTAYRLNSWDEAIS